MVLRINDRMQKRPVTRLNMAIKQLQAWRKSARLPPGEMLRLDVMERSDRRVFLKLAQEIGPVFKGIIDGRFAICVVGNKPARRLLSTHSTALKPVTIDVSKLFPGEFMRGMAGDFHKSQRAIIIKSLVAFDMDAFKPLMKKEIRETLTAFCAEEPTPRQPYDAYHRWSETLSAITTSLLIHLVLGAKPGSELNKDLMNLYHELGPHGVAWNVGDRQVNAFNRIRDRLSAETGDDTSSLFGIIKHQNQVSDTIFGNLIYMVETGRYDMRGLFRWISSYAADYPNWVRRIRTSEPEQRAVIAKAFVQEVLRLDQSERLMREVLQDIVFEGVLIPKGTLLRICMWEAHKDQETFDDPFAFRPERFLGEQTFGERFSPFGLDQHLCPFSAVSINLAATFLIELATHFELGAKGGVPAVRGPYHWEPAPDFSVSLTRIQPK